MNTTVTPADISAADLPGWTVREGTVPTLRTTAGTGSFAAGLEFVNRVGELAEAADHHPDIELTYPRVTISLTTHEAGGITLLDLDLAREITILASDSGIELSPNI